MRGPLKPVAVSLLILVVLIGYLVWSERETNSSQGAKLLVYCAAGMSAPVEAIARRYESEYGAHVQLQFGGSGTLLNNLQVAKHGDIYLAADATYVDQARDKGLTAETMAACKLRPVMVVPKGNPNDITSPADLARADIRIALANPEAASVGRVTQALLESLYVWTETKAAVEDRGVFKPTVNDLANDVKIGTIDAGIVWDAVANQYPELDIVPIDGAEAFEQEVTLALLKSTEQPAQALRFMRYMTARDRGLETFAAMGFPPVEGDAWAVKPEIVYFSGGVNRVAIEETLATFEQREGVRILTTYNGCGILVGQIKAGEKPDVYHTCDASFMEEVRALFGDIDAVSKTDIVILVQEGNPSNIRSLDDLARPGLQIGVCTEDLSTLGTMTARLLREVGLYDTVQKNVVVTNPQGDMLVAQLTVGDLDAAIVYRANTVYVGDETDVIDITLPGWVAMQTYTVARETAYPNLLERLRHAIRAEQTQAQYEQTGFDFLAETAAVSL